MAREVVEENEPDPLFGKHPHRSVYVLRQLFNSFIYVCLVVLVLLLAATWTIVITFSVVPIIVWKRGYRKVFEYYSAPFELQRDLFRSYRDALWKGSVEWDFEKGKPQPVALQQRGFISHQENLPVQRKPSSFLRFPAELRLKIYKEIIIGDGTHISISVHRRKKGGEKRAPRIIHARRTSEEFNLAPRTHCNCFEIYQRDSCQQLQSEVHWQDSCLGLLALSRTCRQVYMETIELLYSMCFHDKVSFYYISAFEAQFYSNNSSALPTFHFDTLTQPPFFLESILPQRLALIKNIRICYNQCVMKNPCTPLCRRKRLSKHRHRLQQCARCNFDQWLDIICKTMTGLERIDVLVYADTEMVSPSIDESWITHLFKLQHGDNGPRDLRIHTLPVLGGPYLRPGSIYHVVAHEHSAETEQFNTFLQDMIKNGAAAHSHEEPAIESTEISETLH